jgi:hypothetical protein
MPVKSSGPPDRTSSRFAPGLVPSDLRDQRNELFGLNPIELLGFDEDGASFRVLDRETGVYPKVNRRKNIVFDIRGGSSMLHRRSLIETPQVQNQTMRDAPAMPLVGR